VSRSRADLFPAHGSAGIFAVGDVARYESPELLEKRLRERVPPLALTSEPEKVKAGAVVLGVEGQHRQKIRQPTYLPQSRPPVIFKAVRVAKTVKRIRVRYTVAADDAVDGSVPVSCKPRPGSFFRLGRTHVACTATDTSGNTAKTSFSVTVKRR
jgi:hypothetical protein